MNIKTWTPQKKVFVALAVAAFISGAAYSGMKIKEYLNKNKSKK